MLLAVMAAGAGVGLGAVLAVRAVFPRPVPLARALADLERPRRPLADLGSTSPTPGMADRIGRAVLRVVESTGMMDLGGLRRRLRTLDKPIEAHAFAKLLGGVAGFLLPIVFALTVAAAGVSISPAAIAVASGVLALEIGRASGRERG